MAYANGQIPLSALTVAYGSHRLRADAAAAYQRLNIAYSEGTTGKKGVETDEGRLVITEAYRDLARQRYLSDGWIRRLPGFNLAAKPGTSNHGWGIACDFGGMAASRGTKGHNWLRANAGKYGWEWVGSTFSPVEAWHWEYKGGETGGGSGGSTAKGDPEIALTQSQLEYLGNNPGVVDGLKGDKLRESLKDFQIEYNLNDKSGLYGPESHAHLTEAVAKCQRALVAKGFNAGVADGNPGLPGSTSNTRNATKAFQKSVNLTDDGRAGKNTRGRLFAAPEAGKVEHVVPVKQFQGALRFIGNVLDVDDKYGPTTENIVKAFQVSKGLKPDGIVGNDTWGALCAEVRAIQERLIVHGFLPAGSADGIYGSQSEAALKAFQKAKGLDPDAIAGTNTRSKLAEAPQAPVTPPVTTPEPTPATTYKNWVFGLDMSYAQKNVDYQSIVASGVKHVTLKVGGADQSKKENRVLPYKYVDSQFETHYKGFREAGIEHIDFYWWQDGLTSPEQQAKDFWAMIENKIRPGELAKLDFESWGELNPFMTPAQVLIFMDTLKVLMGSTPVFYSYTSKIAEVNLEQVAKNYPLWVAQYGKNDGTVGSEPTPKYWTSFIEWQYTSSAKVNGFSGNLDANYLDPAARAKYGFIKKPVQPPVVVVPPVVTPEPEKPATGGLTAAQKATIATALAAIVAAVAVIAKALGIDLG